MNKNILLSMIAAIVIIVLAWLLVQAPQPQVSVHEEGEVEDASEEIAKGPRGGKLFSQDGFAIELVLYESGVPPEYHAYAYLDGELLPPDTVDLAVELGRLGGQRDQISFSPLDNFLRGKGVVSEPHSFDVSITASHDNKSFEWNFSSYEGRTVIPGELAKEAGIETEIAASAVLSETVDLTGRVQVDPVRQAQVRARFPGVVQSVRRNLGENVSKGDVLATVQSNESLQTYNVKAPIDGLIIRRDLQVGGITSNEVLFTIVDLSQVWVELDIFGRNVARIKPGQAVRVVTLDGEEFPGQIAFVSPLAQHASQSVQARVILDNVNGQLRPGQYVRGLVIVVEHPVSLAVRRSAIQDFRDFKVVFMRIGDTYEVRMLELGRENSEWIEVLGGLEAGTEYVTANSYLVKADIEKSGASHDH